MDELCIRTDDEIYALMDSANEARNNGSKFPGMSYEEGIIAALEWLITDGGECPMEL